MATAPLLQLADVALSYGGAPLFAGLDLAIQPGDRIALVGRNGAGKSTLMKIMAGLVEADGGDRTVLAGVTVGYMEQNPDFEPHATLGEVAAGALVPSEAWRAEMAAEGLEFDPSIPVEKASGGERRRAALVRLLAAAPDVMLLDEPTNHLDIAAITWLEERLAQTTSAFALISHDRAFLRRLSRSVLWVDRGAVRRLDRGFEQFESWRDATWAEEDLARHKLDRRIKAEGRWAVEGISARRKRNQGRLRALADMRALRAEEQTRKGTADLALASAPQSGRRVIEAQGIAKAFGDRQVLKPLSLRVMRGDRVAIVGPNGAGKTTLVRLLTGRVDPDAGSVVLGANIEMAEFDQNRAALEPEATLWDSLVGDPEMRVSGRADQVMVRGEPRHVVGYLKDFLFDEDRARAPVRSLSGGEQARLLLARLMAKRSNLLVLDEPTNDLDIETLDLLQETIADYDGTVLMVSHDRDFIDRVATTTVVLRGDGGATAFAGGWSDAVAQGARIDAIETPAPSQRPKVTGASRPRAAPAVEAPRAADSLSFTERHRLKELPSEIARLEAEIARLADFLSSPDLYADAPAKFAQASRALAARQAALAAAEEEWLTLEERSEA